MLPGVTRVRGLSRARFLRYLGLTTVIGVLVRTAAYDWPAPDAGFHGHGYCYLWQPSLVAAHAGADSLIGVSYLAISLSLVYLVGRTRAELPFSWIFVAFGSFIVACGATHLMDVWTLWTPLFWLSADIKMITAAASVATAVALPPLIPKVLRLVEEAKLSEQRRMALEQAQRDLEERVRSRTAELAMLLEHEQSLRAAAEAASHAKQEFLATVSHELRTPLNAILGWSEMLQQPVIAADRLQHGLTSIARNARVQAQVVDDLLDVAAIAAGKLDVVLTPVELQPIVHSAVESLMPSARARGLALHVTAHPLPIVIKGDSARLQQVIWNLLANAVKFTPAGGRIDVHCDVDDASAFLEVRDSGKGIPPEFLPCIFDRFSQEDGSYTRAQGGLGLGLAIVKHLVDLHKGEVQAFSDGPGRGTTFRVTLPMVLHPPTAVPHGASDRASVLTDRAILVIDDDPDGLDVATAALEQAGAAVVRATSVQSGLAAVRSQVFDIVVCDIGMPGEDGYRFLKRLRADKRAVPPVIALTGYASQEEADRAVAAGFARHLAKPVSPSTLVAVITEMLQAG